MSPILGIYASQQSGHFSSFYSIATQTVGAGGASSITFSSIPSTYTHLQVRLFSNATLSTGYLRFNGDTGANYSTHYLLGNGSSASAGALSSSTYIYGLIDGSSNFAANIIDILDYSNTSKNKTTRTLSGIDENGSGDVVLYSGAWYNTAAITSLTLLPSSGNFSQYSSFALYGVR